MTFDRAWWFLPKVAFTVSIILCALRVAIKLFVGKAIASPLLFADGVHNIGDTGIVVAAGLVSLFLWFVAYKKKGVYGADNLPAIFQLAIVVLMGWLAFSIGQDITRGLSGSTPRLMDFSSLGIAALALGASVVISLSVSSYQVRSKIPSLVAAGNEMRGDALIECSILAGFVAEYLLPASWAAWIEYLFGLVVIYWIVKTAWKMFIKAWDTLLQVSIGKEFEAGIRSLVLSTYGVGDIVKLETYPLLETSVRVKVRVFTQGGAEANEDIKGALEGRIREYTLAQGHPGCNPDLFFAIPDSDWHRVAYALVEDSEHSFVAPGRSHANTLRVCAVEHGEIISGEDFPMPQTLDEFLAFMRSKHIRIYRAWDEEEVVVSALNEQGVRYKKTPTILPPQQ